MEEIGWYDWPRGGKWVISGKYIDWIPFKWDLTYLVSLAESNRTPIPAFCLSNYQFLDNIFILVMIYHVYYDRVHSYTWNIKICLFLMGLPV